MTFDGFEDILNRELQWDEDIVHLVGSEWALLRMRERLLLESALSAILDVDGGVSVLWLRFCSVVAMIES